MIKILHIVSATILFGTGLGTAVQMWLTHRSGDPRALAVVARNVVRADFFFTAPAVVVQPVTGAALIAPTGADPLAHGWWPPTRSMRSPACAGCRSFGCKSESAGSHTMP